MYNIEIYENRNGKSEVRDYIRDIKLQNNKDNKIKFEKITAYIRMLKKYGLPLGKPYIKHIDGEIWELRPLRDRILFAIWNDSFILLNLFAKQTQKTPKREIEKAKRLLEDYKKRRGEDG